MPTGVYKRTEKYKEKLRISSLGKNTWSKGRTLSEETKKKCSISHTGPKNHFYGKKHSDGSKLKMSLAKKGKPGKNKGKHFNVREKHPAWKGGISKDVHSTSEPRYKEWRMKVFSRDGFRCKICKEKKGLQAHHILKWAEFPELRYEINNGIALCLTHHPRKWAEEKRLAPEFQKLVSVSKENY